MQKLVDGLKHFRNHVLRQRRGLFERAAEAQRPTSLLITFSDSRVLPETLMQADPGDLFVSRNAGNLVPPPEVPSGEAAPLNTRSPRSGSRTSSFAGIIVAAPSRRFSNLRETKSDQYDGMVGPCRRGI